VHQPRFNRRYSSQIVAPCGSWERRRVLMTRNLPRRSPGWAANGKANDDRKTRPVHAGGSGRRPDPSSRAFWFGLVSNAADNIGTNSRVTAPAPTIAVPRLRDRARREGDVALPQSRKPPRLRYGEPGLLQKQPTSVLGIQPCDVVSIDQEVMRPVEPTGERGGLVRQSVLI
jgi:hypothetical protein